MGSMPPDIETLEEKSAQAGESAQEPASADTAALRGSEGAHSSRRRSALKRARRSAARFLDRIAADDVKRQRSSLAVAILVNAVVLSLMAVYGKVHIWIPSTPGESLSIVMVELPLTPLQDLRDPEPIQETTPEPEEPEVIEEPELDPEPAPDPAPPEPERETTPEPEPLPEPETEPEPETPPLDLTPDPLFAPPTEVEDGALIPEVDPGLEEEPGPLTIIEQEGADLEVAPEPLPAPEEQTPAEDAPPLVEPEPSPDPQSGLETTETEYDEAPEIARGEEEEDENPPANDEAFDEEPVFGGRAFQLPAVELPTGSAPATPGASGVVAIFCPEEFEDADKAAECAGRTEIRSGWRPGASGEDWSKAIQLLRQAQDRGGAGEAPGAGLGPNATRQAIESRQERELLGAQRGVSINDPAGSSSGNLDSTLGQPDIGPKEFEPTWTLPEDPNVSQRDLRKLEKALEEAEKEKQADPEE